MTIQKNIMLATFIISTAMSTASAQAWTLFDTPAEKIQTSTTGRHTTREAAEHVSTLLPPVKEVEDAGSTGNSGQPPRIPV